MKLTKKKEIVWSIFFLKFCFVSAGKETNKKSQIGNDSKQQDLVATELDRNTSEPLKYF